MSISISLEQALTLRNKGALLVDARSPDEFAEATIPGAINVPILDNAERQEVGTLYKQVGKQQARRRGVQIVAPKIPAMVDQVAALPDPVGQVIRIRRVPFTVIGLLETKGQSMMGADQDDVIADYEAHFDAGAAEGRSELEVAEALGNPGRLARPPYASWIGSP